MMVSCCMCAMLRQLLCALTQIIANVLLCNFVQFDGQAAAAGGARPFVAGGGRVQKSPC